MLWSLIRLPIFLFKKMYKETCTLVILFDNGATVRIKHVTACDVSWKDRKCTKLNISFLTSNGFCPVLGYNLDKIVAITTV